VRAYDVFIETLDFNKLGIFIEENKSGANPYHPKAMLKLVVYGYAYGIRSSRKLERAAKHNLSFIWLTGNLQPDYRTIARFRRDNTNALKNVLKQCVHMCVKLNLIEGNTLFIDGSKIKANASLNNTMTEQEFKEQLEEITKNIERILAECERIDSAEEDKGSLVELSKELQNQEQLASKIKNVLKEFDIADKEKINLTDPDSVKSKGDRGTKMYHNAQITVDEKNGLIVSSDIVSQVNDSNQFKEQVEQAQKNLGKKVKTACADSGYSYTEDLKKVSSETVIVVPSQQQVQKEHGLTKPFDKSAFKYDLEKDEYICPMGKRLRKVGGAPFDRTNCCLYQAHREDCHQCQHFGICTSSKQGRKLVRMTDEIFKEQLEKIYSSPEGQKTYKLRKEKAELPFAHIKHNMGFRQFLLRYTQGAKAEISLLATGFNINRMITLLGGITGFMVKIPSV
jgi:transposase